MAEARGTVTISFRPNWVNGWFLRVFARGFAEVNGDETECRWGEFTTITVPAGRVRLTTFIRYRGTRVKLGSGSVELIVAGGARYNVVTRNGMMNQTPFTPVLTPVAP